MLYVAEKHWRTTTIAMLVIGIFGVALDLGSLFFSESPNTYLAWQGKFQTFLSSFHPNLAFVQTQCQALTSYIDFRPLSGIMGSFCSAIESLKAKISAKGNLDLRLLARSIHVCQCKAVDGIAKFHSPIPASACRSPGDRHA